MSNKHTVVGGKVFDETGEVVGKVNRSGQIVMYSQFTSESIDKATSRIPIYGEKNLVTGVVEFLVNGDRQQFHRVSILEQLVATTARKLLHWGDSTIEAAAGNAVIPFEWGTHPYFDAIPGLTQTKNFGSSGLSVEYMLANPPITNIGGVVVSPESVGSECAMHSVSGVVFSFGLNDFRLRTDIAGVYGNATVVAAVKSLQQGISTAVARMRASAGRTVPVIFMVPNTVTLTGPYLGTGNGFTGQHVTDALRMAYLGDAYLGVPSLDAIIASSEVCDSGGAVFGSKSWVLAERPMHMTEDGLHPNTEGYALRTRYIAEWIASLGALSAMTKIASGRVITSESNYLDLTFVERLTTLFGDGNGTTYGASAVPVLGIGDTVKLTYANGITRKLTVSAVPYQNSADYYLRWVGQGIDGQWHDTDIPDNTPFVIERQAKSTVFEAVASKAGYAVYPVRVVAGGNGTCTVLAVPGGKSLVDRPPTANDYIALGSTGGKIEQGMVGIALSGATIISAGSPGKYTIVKAGTNYTAAVGQLGAIVVLI